MTKITLSLAILSGLYLLHRLCLWLESKGWIYYINKKAETGVLGSSLQELNSFLSPGVRHTIEMKQNQVTVDKQRGSEPPSGANNNTITR